MSEYAVMPMEDYIGACEAVRKKTATENPIKSGELSSKILNVYDAAKEDFGNKKTVNGEKKVTAEYIKEAEHSVSVKLSSKEFISFPYYNSDWSLGNIALKINPDGTVTLNGTGLIQWYFTNPNSTERPILPAGSYSLSGIPENFADFWLYLNDTDGTFNKEINGNTVFTIDTECSFLAMLSETVTQATYENITFRPSLKRMDVENVLLTRYGEKESDNPQTYTTNADGTVEGVTSLSPIMNLETDCDGIIIEAEYYAKPEALCDSIWDSIQNYGKRTNYPFFFYYCGHYSGTSSDFYNIKPKYPLKVSDGRSIFESFYISLDLSEYLETSDLKIDFSAVNNATSMFAFSSIKRVPPIKVISGNVGSMFNYASIETIDGFEIETTATKVTNPFNKATKLQNITWNGTISFSGIDLSSSTLLTKASLESVINALSDATSNLSITLPLTAVKREFETAEGALDGNTSAEWETLVAKKPNWTITLG